MEKLNWDMISAIIVDMIIISILVSTIYQGQRKGLTGVVFTIVTFVASIIIVLIVYKPVANLVIENTQIDEWFSIRIEEAFKGTSLENGELIVNEESNISKSVVDVVNKLMKESIDELKGNALTYVSTKLSHFIVNVLTMIVVLIIAKVLLGFAKSIIDLIAKFPIIHLVDKSGGIIYGLLKGLVIIYLILAILSIISPLIAHWKVLDAINESYIGSRLYNNNILLKLVVK